jgi:MFS family permease
MRPSRNFINITIADFIVRSAYQMGKTPLLPLFAAALGATDVLLGSIVAISTLTGMVTKPLFGILSDRQGRRWWIILGTLFFATVPFLYRFIDTPGQLVAIRVLHGTATAIYGPVTVAFVAERGGRRKAESLGWFGIARSGGYIVGPAVAGWMLLTMDPAAVFTIVGLISCAAFVPVLLLNEDDRPRPDDGRPALDDRRRTTDDGQPTMDNRQQTTGDRRPARYSILNTRYSTQITHYALRITNSVSSFLSALRTGARTPAVWLSGSMEATVYVALYAAKAFLPIYALTAGYNTMQVGLFFSVQEGVHLVLKPFAGRFGDRVGYFRSIAIGMLLIAAVLPLLTFASSFGMLLGLAALLGVAQALIFPSTIALVTDQIAPQHLGAGLGLVGTLDNVGKVAGPVLGGLLIARLDYSGMFWLMGAFLLIGAVVVMLRRPGEQRTAQYPLSAHELSGG